MLLRMSLSPRVSVSAAAGRAAIAAPPPTTHVFAYARAMRPASTMRTHASHRSSMALRSLVTAANARLNQFHQQQQQQQEQQQNREDSRTHEEESRRDDTRSGSRFSFWTPFRFIGRQARLAFDWYARRLDTSPVITQSLTSGFLFLIGDITAQRYEDRLDRDKGIDTSDRPYLDLKRVAACTSFGLFVLGPFGHYWYSRLDVWTNRLYAPRTMKNVGMKVLLDTAIFNPIFLIVFFTVVSLLEGLTMNDIGHKLYRDFVPSYAVDCSVWPPIQTVNFRFVPVKFQLLVVNLGCYFDDVFLSYVQHNGMPWIFQSIEHAWLEWIGDESILAQKQAAALGEAVTSTHGGEKFLLVPTDANHPHHPHAHPVKSAAEAAAMPHHHVVPRVLSETDHRLHRAHGVDTKLVAELDAGWAEVPITDDKKPAADARKPQ